MMKKLLTLFLALAASVGTLFAQSGTCGNNLTWNLSDGTLTISGTGAMTNYWYSEAPWDSYRESIKTVKIGSSVTSIGEHAFYECSKLTSVTIPNSVTTIGGSAFKYCSSLTSIIIPNSVTSIGGTAFQYCGSLTSITIPNSVTSIGSGAFYSCSSLTSIAIPNSVTSIGDNAFRFCGSLTSITIPNSVTSIESEAFRDCSSLTSITIPNSVTSIGVYAFYDCSSLSSITCQAVNPPSLGTNVFYHVDKSIPLYVPAQSIDLYKAADQWKDFTNILPIEGTDDDAGMGIGSFSVSATQQVTFAPGNLQFNAASGTHKCADGTIKQGTWRFAEHQWDIVGMGYGQTDADNYCYIGGTVQNGDNRNISSTDKGWIDLFGWGTSGWNSGANAYEPWSTSTSNSDYYLGGNYQNSLSDNYANADWGVYNQIGEDDPGTWRTLTYDEWSHLIYYRTNASSKSGQAKVNGMTGVVILPDVFTLPAGCGFTAGMTSASNMDDWSLVNTTNIYTVAQWQLMEAAGAVFLPASGYLFGSSMYYAGTRGFYWSSSANDTYGACYLDFDSYGLGTGRNYNRYNGRSVRLVRSLSGLDDTPDTYTVTFVNYDGTELQSSMVEAGSIPEYKGETPTKPSDAQYTYTFAGWDKEIAVVTADATYTATFEAIAVGGGATGGIGLFSVSATQKVTFSQGNLQYRASDNTWRFANEQYDVISWEQNKQLSQTCNQWIDLFKFASSGYNGFYPWADNTYNSSEDITNTNYDWGVYNPIVNGGNKAGMWRTLTISEWTYLFNERKNANSLFGVACVNGINGLIILPDEFDVSTCSINTSHSGYTNNILTIEQWKAFETNGAIFLPANGHIPLGNQGNLDGFYWSSTADNWCNDGYADVGAYAWYFYYNDIRSTDPDWMQDRRSVRLVRDTIVPALNTIEKHLSGYFSIGNGKTVKFSSGNLQYRASDNTWRFANEQYDVIGNDNTNISDTYSGWIDLFGWGTGNNPTLSSTDENQYPTFVDWGINPIVNGGNQPNLWRTLSASEMGYIFGGRPNADKLYSMCVVNGRHGLIVFPDNCDIPQNIDFVPAYKDFTNDVNNYTLEEWQQLEAVGAVFFPVAGVRKGLSVSETEESGYYWHTDALSSSTGAREMWLGRMYIYYNPGIGGTCDRANGISVRLVRDQNEQEPVYSLSVSVDGEGTVTGADEYKKGTTATLTATAASGYTFSQWSDGNTDNPRTITMMQNLTLTAVFTAISGGATGSIGAFSVSATQKVTFAPGNLQFNAASGTHKCADGTTKQGTWRFAEHQWDYVGSANKNISSSYNGWIDLFGWGTSGWNSGANAYQPYSTSQTNSDYYPGGSYENSLTGNYANADWGVYNQIGDDAPGSWRTLTKDEWVYLFHGRTNYANLFGLGTVNGVQGTIILPDSWVTPVGLTFTPSTSKGFSWQSGGYYYNSNHDNYSHNTYTSSQWELMESAGAVFLPTVGYRYGTTVYYTGLNGDYWSTTQYGTSYAYGFNFNSNNLNPPSYDDDRSNGQGVRLVRAAQNEQEPVYSLSVSVEGEGTVTGAGEYKSGTTATLTATPASGYTFSQWSDGKTDNPRTITLASDTTFTAIFEEDIILPEAQIWPVIMDHITSDKYQQNIVGDFRDNGIDNHQYIWVNGETYTIRTAFGLNYYGNNGGYTSLTVKAPDGWSGGGFHVANAQSLKMMKVLKDSIVAHPDDYYLHIAIKSNDHASHDFRLFDNEQLTFTIGTTPIYQGTVIGDFPRDGEWHGLYIPLASFADNIAVTNLDETELGLHVFSFLSGDAVGAELNLDAVYFCNTAFKDKECVSYRYNVYSTDGGIVSANYSECPQNKLSLNAQPDYGYHFTQWSDGNTDNPRTITMTQDTTLTAVFAKNTFLISFVNYDGSELQSSEVEAGTMPQYNGATPTKPADEDNTYTFSGWTPAVVAVAGNASYTATFQSVPFVKYTITWQDEDGNVIKTDQVAQGATPAFTGTTPTKEGYTFAGWLPNIKPATKDICYTTFFERNKIETPVYTVNINGENCSLNINNQYPEGTVITLEAVADECFEFQQWSDGNKENPRSVTVTKDMSLTAEFNKVRYTVTGQPSTGGQVQIHKQ